MSATCKVWLQELDKGREHYKDFNDKNKYTGWRSGLVKTSEIEKLKQLTFQVTIQIFEIYDKDGNNVTNRYIGLGIDSKQTITYLRKELQYEKAKVQRLTIELDELYQKVHKYHPLGDTSVYDEDDDDEKSISIPIKHSKPPQMISYSTQLNERGITGITQSNNRDICNIKFEEWLIDIVKLEQYLPNFIKAECNDVRMIEFFDEECLEKDMKIKTKIHRRLIMKKATEFRMAQDDFVNNKLKKNIEIKQILEQNGILSMKDLKKDIKNKKDLKSIINDYDKNDNCFEIISKLLNIE